MDGHATVDRACQSAPTAICLCPSFIRIAIADTYTAMQNGTDNEFYNSTIRQTLHMSIGASQIRVRVSNAFGPVDLNITAVTVALPTNGAAGSPMIQTHALQQLTFDGSTSFIVPSSSLVVSDPINFPVKPQSMITVTMYLAGGQQGQSITSHPGSRTNTWISYGNHVNAANLTDPSVQSVAHWYSVYNTFSARSPLTQHTGTLSVPSKPGLPVTPTLL